MQHERVRAREKVSARDGLGEGGLWDGASQDVGAPDGRCLVCLLFAFSSKWTFGFCTHYQDAKISTAQGQEGFESLVGDSPNYRVIG